MKAKAGKTSLKTYLVEAIPLSRSPLPGGTLSYFSSTKLSAGALVHVPVRNSLSPALVISSKDVRSAKQDIRRAGFALRKIRKSDITEASLGAALLETVQETAHYYATSVGNLATTLLPKLVVRNLEAFLKPDELHKPRPIEAPSRETLLLQMEGEERFGQYRALVRQSFAREASVIFVVPTHLDAARVKEELSRGITEFVHLFTLEMKPAEATKSWQKAMSEKHPVLFITTPAGISFPRADVDTVIVERANSRAYRMLVRPYADLRFFIEKLALKKEWRLVTGDAVLPVELLSRIKGVTDHSSTPISEMSLIRWRLPAAPAHIVDASSKQDGEGRFEIFSPELKELIQRALTASGKDTAPGKVFLFGARKGLAPTTVCGDCGTVLPCRNCGAPVVLHKKGHKEDGSPETMYVCHACGATRESLTACNICGGWRLVPLGIGTQEIARQAKLLFPTARVSLLDKDHAPVDAKARLIAEQFEEKGGILVGTELAFFHLTKVPFVAAVSLDALFSVPDFHVNERIFYLMSRLREMAVHETLIQTRRGTGGNQVLVWAAQGNILDFYQSEIAEREMLSYPPFSIFVKIETQDRNALIPLKESFAAWNPDIYKNSVIMRLPKNAWPEEQLVAKLALLGPSFSVKVDPDSIL